MKPPRFTAVMIATSISHECANAQGMYDVMGMDITAQVQRLQELVLQDRTVSYHRRTILVMKFRRLSAALRSRFLLAQTGLGPNRTALVGGGRGAMIHLSPGLPAPLLRPEIQSLNKVSVWLLQ